MLIMTRRNREKNYRTEKEVNGNGDLKIETRENKKVERERNEKQDHGGKTHPVIFKKEKSVPGKGAQYLVGYLRFLVKKEKRPKKETVSRRIWTS